MLAKILRQLDVLVRVADEDPVPDVTDVHTRFPWLRRFGWLVSRYFNGGAGAKHDVASRPSRQSVQLSGLRSIR